ncbi:MAG: quinoprotein dehydrogenase-associated SoxYZ-like carrier [Granulosicoccus sp.]
MSCLSVKRTASCSGSLYLLIGLIIGLCICLVPPAYAEAASRDVDLEERWEILRQQLFGEQELVENDGVIQVEAPGRAFDGARVPITVRSLLPHDSTDVIEKLYIIVDNNPMPVAGTFDFETDTQWDTLDTELRINEYSYLRAVAQLDDGRLFMSSSYVKAVGGCSAPPSSYERSDATLLGSFSGGVEELFNPKVPAVARIRLVHPNASGMQFDQFTRTYIPAHYIHTIQAKFNQKTLVTLSTNFSLGQDPVLGFNFKPDEAGKLTLSAIDSKNKVFEQNWHVSGI